MIYIIHLKISNLAFKSVLVSCELCYDLDRYPLTRSSNPDPSVTHVGLREQLKSIAVHSSMTKAREHSDILLLAAFRTEILKGACSVWPTKA